ncbi:MAG TPA: PKD domain-containing protein [Bacteroidales bacterium]|nr:PKD domain-containing protein [Bacteroidales bacterium]
MTAKYSQIPLVRIMMICALLMLSMMARALPVIFSVTANSANVARYEKLELTVHFSATYTNPFDFGQVNLKAKFFSPSGKQFVMDGFYMQDYAMNVPNQLTPVGQPKWLLRFAPDETGTWSYIVSVMDALGTTSYETRQFVCTASSHKGFIKRDGNKLKYKNGEIFQALGVNLAFQWWWDGFAIYEDWIDELAANGGNFTKLSMAPWIFEIEWQQTGTGQYLQRQNFAWVLDWVFDQLMEKQMYCQFNVMIHDELRTDVNFGWNQNPYNDVLGGPCHEPQNFLVNPTAISLYKRKLRYINARWGYSPQLAMWEHISEADATGLYESFGSQTSQWINSMTDYIQSLDTYQRPVSTGFAIPQNGWDTWNYAGTDFTQLHVYDFIPDLEMKIYNYSRWGAQTWNKPFVISEFALGHNPAEIIQNDPAGITFHNVLWSSMFSGAFGSAMSWYWDNYLYPNGMFSYLKPVADFFSDAQPDLESLHPEVPLSTSSDYETISVKTGYNNGNSKTPQNYFELSPAGTLAPPDLFIGYFLYGSLYNNRRNPPTFKVNYIVGGSFKVHTDDIALFSKIKIKIDGVTMLEQVALPSSTYSVNVPAGQHEIRIENSGSSMVRIKRYDFGNYAPQLRTFVLRNNKYVAGWMQNRKYNWQYLQQFGTPLPAGQAKIYLNDLTPGQYEFTWYNSNSEVDSLQQLFTTTGNLEVKAPAIIWDGAFKAEYRGTAKVAFSASPVNGLAPLAVQFTDQSVYAGPADSWLWDFGDGSTSTSQSPFHIYQQAGNYTVSFTVMAGQYSQTITRSNYINCAPPLVPDFTADTTWCRPGEPIQFIDLSLGAPATWFWQFGDGQSSATQHPVHSYANPGEYTVSLFVQKGSSVKFKTKTNYIKVLEHVVADFAADANVAACGQTINFTDLTTGNPTWWHWDFGNGVTSILQNPEISYEYWGTYNVTLIAANDFLGDTITKTAYIQILKPLVAEFVALPYRPWNGQTVYFVDYSTGNPDNWLWDFGDGATATDRFSTHIYTSPGYYTVTLTISDTLQSATVVKNNYIRQRDTLAAAFVADTLVAVPGETITFTDLSKGNPLQWLWQFGDGQTSSLQNPVKSYDAPGLFSLSLKVQRNDSTNIEMKSDYIQIIPSMVSDFLADTLTARPGEVIHFTDITTGNPTHWLWDFGNGINSPYQNAQVIYTNPGTYSVSLLAWNQYLSSSATKTDFITVVPNLKASFGVQPYEGKIGELIRFTDQSIGFPTQWEWWLGNGDTSYRQNPATIYMQPGQYDVTLIVANAYARDTLSFNDYYYIHPPLYSHNIAMREGWSGISSYVRPALTMDDLFGELSASVLFAYNSQGIYRPFFGINTIGKWQPEKGLIICLLSPQQLLVEGYSMINKGLYLAEGWSVLPVTMPCNVATDDLYSILGDDLEAIKEVADWHIYWPEKAINTLPELQLGKLYFIKMKQARSLILPGCE